MKKVLAVAVAVVAMLTILFYVGRAIVAATSPSTEPLTAEEQLRREACYALRAGVMARAQAARDAESRDPAWASAAEQKLRKFASRRFAAGEIELIAVECKTTFCTLEARTLTGKAEDRFGETLGAALKDREVHDEFAAVSSSRTEDPGIPVYSALLMRELPKDARPKQPDAEPTQWEACQRLLYRWQYRPDSVKSH